MKDKTLLQALILGVGQVGAKILSLVFLFRFANDLGKSTMSLYAFAYVPFSLFADLACFGLIPGTSKLVSKLLGQNDEEKVNYLLKRGTLYCIIAGIFFFLFMLFFSRQILSVSLFDGYDEATFETVRTNLLMASLSLFVLPLLHFYKGFLQGHFIMYPSCISIILENVVKLVLYIVLAKFIYDTKLVFSVFIIYLVGYIASFILLFCYVFPYYRKKSNKFASIPTLLKTSIPFGIATMFFTIYQFIDSISLPILLPVEGYYTAYMFETIRLIFFPIVIAQALGGVLNPRINYMFQEDRVDEAKAIAERCSSLIIFILVPFMILMRYFSADIYNLFYKQENGATILYHVASFILFFGLYKVLIGISLGLPKAHYIIIGTIISAIAKYILNYIFVPKVGYLGAVYATLLAITICILAAYYVLYKEGICLFIKNVKDIILSVLTTLGSMLAVVLFRVCFLLNHYPAYYSVILYSVLLIGVYYISIKIFKQTYRYCIK
ncbi:MAG: oligosaccharide flippase family protein [Acholeplasmatales bacterium]|jgi:O-antigen/teichoic acid export membrane protein|nr:oligosaccharide flippase family protein [Acholeplasmatales bacterium]